MTAAKVNRCFQILEYTYTFKTVWFLIFALIFLFWILKLLHGDNHDCNFLQYLTKFCDYWLWLFGRLFRILLFVVLGTCPQEDIHGDIETGQRRVRGRRCKY